MARDVAAPRQIDLERGELDAIAPRRSPVRIRLALSPDEVGEVRSAPGDGHEAES